MGLLTGARPAVAAVDPGPVAPAALRRAATFLGAMLDAYPGRYRLPQSYADEVGLGDTAYTYDAAVAVLAWLAEGGPDSMRRAMLVAKSLAYALDTDGRLKRSYHADGFEGLSARHGNTVTGDLAVVGIAWVQLAARTDSTTLRAAARRLGDWIVDECAGTGPLGGYTVGTNAAGRMMAARSTAHNADLVEFFRQLAELTGEARWRAAAAEAEAFVKRMWLPAKRRFAVGSPDGTEVDDATALLDAQTRPVLALGSRYEAAIDWAERALAVLDTAARPNSALRPGQWFRGVTVGTGSLKADVSEPIEPGLPAPDPQAVWFEGTAQFTAALRICPNLRDRLTAGFNVGTLATAQAILAGGQHVGGRPLPPGAGVPAASSPLHIGSEPSGYYPVRHVGATGWLLLGALCGHPWRPFLTP